MKLMIINSSAMTHWKNSNGEKSNGWERLDVLIPSATYAAYPKEGTLSAQVRPEPFTSFALIVMGSCHGGEKLNISFSPQHHIG